MLSLQFPWLETTESPGFNPLQHFILEITSGAFGSLWPQGPAWKMPESSILHPKRSWDSSRCISARLPLIWGFQTSSYLAPEQAVHEDVLHAKHLLSLSAGVPRGQSHPSSACAHHPALAPSRGAAASPGHLAALLSSLDLPRSQESRAVGAAGEGRQCCG